MSVTPTTCVCHTSGPPPHYLEEESTHRQRKHNWGDIVWHIQLLNHLTPSNIVKKISTSQYYSLDIYLHGDNLHYFDKYVKISYNTVILNKFNLHTEIKRHEIMP